MTLAQVEERLTALEQVVQRLTTLEQVVEQLQARKVGASKPEVEEDDFIPGAEYDLVVTVPPHASFHFQAHIVSIQTPPAELGLSDADWALYGLEDEDE